MDNLIGRDLGRYHILKQLGEGGMATVYKAYDVRLERDVAIKIIRTEPPAPPLPPATLPAALAPTATATQAPTATSLPPVTGPEPSDQAAAFQLSTCCQ